MFDFGNVGEKIAAFEERFGGIEKMLIQILATVSPPAAVVLTAAESAVDTIAATATQTSAPIVDHSTPADPSPTPAPVSDAVTKVVSAAADLAALAKTLGL